MGMTIAEKIIAAAAGVESVRPGDIHTVNLDRMMSNDGTTHLTVDMYNNQLNHPHIADPKKLVFIVDHNVPSDNPKTAASQKKMRDFARENGIDFWEGKGVCHQIMMENYVCSGELIFGADSHTCSYGAIGAFGTGVGCTDFLYGMVTGTSWVLVPETVKFNLIGKLPDGVYARDLILDDHWYRGCQRMQLSGHGIYRRGCEDTEHFMIVSRFATWQLKPVRRQVSLNRMRKPLLISKNTDVSLKPVYHSDPDAVYAREYTI